MFIIFYLNPYSKSVKKYFLIKAKLFNIILQIKLTQQLCVLNDTLKSK